jgi:hypothetical protein
LPDCPSPDGASIEVTLLQAASTAAARIRHTVVAHPARAMGRKIDARMYGNNLPRDAQCDDGVTVISNGPPARALNAAIAAPARPSDAAI